MTIFANKTIWITGASSGIGRSLAEELAKNNAKLVLSARRIDVLNDIKSKNNLTDERCLLLPFDAESSNDYDKLTKLVIDKFGQIDYLLNIAGVSQRSLVLDTPLEIDRKIMEINYFAPIALTKSVLKYMISQKSGHILVTSSVVGAFGFPLRSAYSASKHALHGFFETLRAENVDNNIKVTILLPGRVKTNISINAITKDGSKHGVMDPGQAQGISVEKSSKIILNALKKGKKEVIYGGKEKYMVYIRKYLPWLFYRMASKLSPK